MRFAGIFAGKRRFGHNFLAHGADFGKLLLSGREIYADGAGWTKAGWFPAEGALSRKRIETSEEKAGRYMQNVGRGGNVWALSYYAVYVPRSLCPWAFHVENRSMQRMTADIAPHTEQCTGVFVQQPSTNDGRRLLLSWRQEAQCRKLRGASDTLTAAA